MEFGMSAVQSYNPRNLKFDVMRSGNHFDAMRQNSIRRVGVIGDGNCFYRSVVVGLVLQNTSELLKKKQAAFAAENDPLRAEFMAKIIKAKSDKPIMSEDVQLGLANDLRNLTALEYLYHMENWKPFDVDGTRKGKGLLEVLMRGHYASDMPQGIMTKVLKSSYKIFQKQNGDQGFRDIQQEYIEYQSLKEALPDELKGKTQTLESLNQGLEVYKKNLFAKEEGRKLQKNMLINALKSVSPENDQGSPGEVDTGLARNKKGKQFSVGSEPEIDAKLQSISSILTGLNTANKVEFDNGLSRAKVEISSVTNDFQKCHGSNNGIMTTKEWKSFVAQFNQIHEANAALRNAGVYEEVTPLFNSVRAQPVVLPSRMKKALVGN